MSKIIAYETSPVFPIFPLVSLCILAFGVVIVAAVWKSHKAGTLITGLVFLLLGLFLSSVSVVDYIKDYNTIYKPYKDGKYQVCEGFVEQFHPMPDEEHDSESFVVNGVVFVYPDASGYGYSTCQKDGGIITGDGQYVKIRYRPYTYYNVILRLEVVQK